MSGSCQKIKLRTWPRRDIFSFFSALDQPFYSVCFRVDVTQLHTYTKTHGLSFYYVMTYLVTQASTRSRTCAIPSGTAAFFCWTSVPQALHI